LDDEKLAIAKALLAQHEQFTVAAVARQVGVNPTTLYRYLPAPRST